MSETKSPPLKKNLVDVDNQIEDLKVKKKNGIRTEPVGAAD